MLCVGALCVTLPFLLMAYHTNATSQQTSTHVVDSTKLGDTQIQRMLADATAYNQRLAQSGQPVLGENIDPFTHSTSSSDSEYTNLLNRPADNIMSIISYPRLGINLPIAHGTSSQTLLHSAGHLYGTSLPVGGASTHTVISAHSGMADRLMFDRLQGLGSSARVGDVFYLKTLNQTLAYKVTDIQVVNPDNFDSLKIVEGKDLATLLTCTPYGVNTKRLLVTGTRATIPTQAPEPAHAPHSHQTSILITLSICVWILILAVIIKTLWQQTHNTRKKA